MAVMPSMKTTDKYQLMNEIISIYRENWTNHLATIFLIVQQKQLYAIVVLYC